jgi:hypothetical protein
VDQQLAVTAEGTHPRSVAPTPAWGMSPTHGHAVTG